jgi:ribosomal protein S21
VAKENASQSRSSLILTKQGSLIMSRDYNRDYDDRDESDDQGIDYVPYEHNIRDRTGGSIARVRVELKRKYNDPWKNFKDLLQDFKRRVSNRGIMHDYKEHQFFESKSEKKRKARKAATKKFQMEAIEQKINAGDPIKASPGLIKKVKANMQATKEKQNKKRDRYNNPKQYQEDY